MADVTGMLPSIFLTIKRRIFNVYSYYASTAESWLFNLMWILSWIIVDVGQRLMEIIF